MKIISQYIDKNKNNYINELKEFLKIPSISTDPAHKKDIKKCAHFVKTKLQDAGLNNVKVIKTEGHPLIYGEWLKAKGKPTVLIYGHYDVQPVDPIELWDTPPFEPTIKSNKIFARGATDDKGQVYMHIKSVEAYLETVGSLPVNVKFIIEGEEEVGSESLEKFISKNKSLLKCDAVLISDTALYDVGTPTLTYGLRGLCYMEVEVIGPQKDLHSGTFGGAVDNPINVLADMISKLKDKNGKITIPNFYDDVMTLTKKERENFKKLKFSDKKFAKEVGVKQLHGEKGYTTLERLWARPTLGCNGIIGGFIGDGAKTVLPSKVKAKISMRLVPNQDPLKIAKLFEKHIKTLTPNTVKVNVKHLHGANPAIIPLEDKSTIAASKAMEKAFGKKIVFMREGGSVPIVPVFAKQLNASVVLMGLGLNTENLHSPNEHFNLTHFQLGIKCSAYFFDEFAK